MNKDERRDVAELFLEMTMLIEGLVNSSDFGPVLKKVLLEQVKAALEHQKQFSEGGE